MPGRALELAVLGGGPVGCAFALAAHAFGLRPTVFEQRARQSAPAHGERPIALSYASRLILERIGAWRSLTPTPIETIHVSQVGGIGRTVLTAREAEVPALGYVVEYGELERSLLARAEQCEIELVYDARFRERERMVGTVRLRGSCGSDAAELTARCVVHAEGASEPARERHYDQEAVVGMVASDPPAAASAFERFTAEGPLALLPMSGRYAFVWAMRPERAAALAADAPGSFLAALAREIGNRAGRLTAVEGRTRVALALRVHGARGGAREVFIGNAAQTLHPVAGQGLNLGMRDAWELARALRGRADPGDARALAVYVSRRRLDAAATVHITDSLARGLLGGNVLGRAALAFALGALDACAPARAFFARRMIFGPSASP